MSELTITLSDYIPAERMQEIAEEELRYAFRRQLQKEADVERILTNLTHEYVFKLVAEEWDGDLTEQLREKITNVLKSDRIDYEVFRRKDAWDRTESPAVAILDDELKNSRPLIHAAVEKHIAEYPFHELDRDEIGDVIMDVIM